MQSGVVALWSKYSMGLDRIRGGERHSSFCGLPLSDESETFAADGRLQQHALFKRTHFATRLPLDCRYSRRISGRVVKGVLRIGFVVKFATRMLGDMVDHGFEAWVIR